MKPTPGFVRFALILSMLVMGACGLIYEYVLSLMGNNLMGTSYEQIFIIIGLMLFAMGVGTILQRFFRRNLLDTFLLLEFLLGLIGGYSAIAIYAAFTYWESFEVILYGFAFSIGMAIGMEIPLLIRINKEYSKSLRVNLAEILSVDYIGSLAGAFLFTYVLLARFSLPRVSFLLGLTNVAIAIMGFFVFRTLLKRKTMNIVVAALTLGALVPGFFLVDFWTLKAEQEYYQDPIIFRKTTKYQHLVLTKRRDILNLYINGNIQFSSKDEAVYHELLVHTPMAAATRRERVLILGGGDGLALREVLKYPDVKKVYLVDIDPEVVRIAAQQPDLMRLNQNAFLNARVSLVDAGGVKAGKKIQMGQHSHRRTKMFSNKVYPLGEVSVLNLDADLFIRNLKENFDVVIIDFPDPSRLELSKLYSLDFYRLLRRRLNPGAVVSLQSSSSYHAREAYLCIGKTLQAAGFKTLPYHGTVPSFSGEWGWYLAWKGKRSPAQVRAGFQELKKLPVETSYLNADVMRMSFVFGKNRLQERYPVRINTKMSPVLVTYYRKAWDEFE